MDGICSADFFWYLYLEITIMRPLSHRIQHTVRIEFIQRIRKCKVRFDILRSLVLT